MFKAVTPEARAWLGAADACEALELPHELASLSVNLERIEAERANVEAELGPVTAAEKFVAGEDLAAAVELAEEEAEEARHRHETRRTIAAARDLARGALTRWVALHRHELIVDVARPAVAALLDEGRTLAGKLADYGPDYDEARIVRTATKPQLEAWRRVVELDEGYQATHTAWRSTWKAASITGGIPGAPRATVKLGQAPPGLLYWQEPELVSPLMRGEQHNRRGRPLAIPVDLLRVVAEPADAGFRLASLDEVPHAIAERRRAEQLERQAERLERRGGRTLAR
jgi:hypothetical protein